MPSPKTCPCYSGVDYRACCAPYHRGEREAPDAVALMRSRYAAFALGHGEYLFRTLHPDHEDRSRPREPMIRAFSAAKLTLRYQGLGILDSRAEGEAAEVLFFAKIFERGQDRSFVELSQFERREGGWRYLSGILVPHGKLGRPVEGLGIDGFRALAAP